MPLITLAAMIMGGLIAAACSTAPTIIHIAPKLMVLRRPNFSPIANVKRALRLYISKCSTNAFFPY